MRVSLTIRRILFAIIVTFAGPGSAWSCPAVEGLVDYNCDLKARVGFVGDSITWGRGDYTNSGGFVQRLHRRYRRATMVNMGVPGVTSMRLISLLKRFPQLKPAATDLYVVLIGVNDYWERGTPGLTVRNIKRIVEMLREDAPSPSKTPFVVVSTLLPTRVGVLAPYVQEVNSLLLRYRSSKLPVYIRGDDLPSGLLDSSGVHPSPEGYDVLADTIDEALQGDISDRMLSNRPDRDMDGVFDLFEPEFMCDPATADTDGDGYSDGQELFVLKTDPMDPSDPPLDTQRIIPQPLAPSLPVLQ